MMKNLILTYSLVLSFQTLAFCQVIPDMKFQNDSILYEKLYLHIDRELYSPGDDIWFKSYLVNGLNNKLITGFRNIYVQLIAEDGRIIDQRLMLSINGVSNNDFHLPDTIRKGQYIIRGYTGYLQNFGEEILFCQKIAVSGATGLPEFEDKPEEQKTIDVSFLPEGGRLVMNAANYIAFKAINEKGKGIPVTGKIVDEAGLEIVTFESRYKGMGMFVFMPQEGKKYYARIDDYPGFTYQFEVAKTDGIAIHYRRAGDNLLFILSQDIKSARAKNLVLAVSHGGEELFREEFQMYGFQYPVDINEGFFPPGISKITLLDAQNEILAERLVFVRYPDDNTFLITSDKNEYHSREKVTFKIESLLNREEDKIETGLSIAVVNDNYFSGDGRNQTIESYLLFDSELKGSLESPASFFTDEENISADEKLDLVMMVNGWRRYYPDELKGYLKKPLPGLDDVGLTLKGKVKTLWGEKPLKDATIDLGPFSGLFLILKDTTDESGIFNFNRLYIKDSTQIMINVKNNKGRNNNMEVFCESFPVFDSVVPVTETLELNRTTREIELPEKFKHSAYYRYLAESEFKLEEGSILIKEVVVKAEITSPHTVTGPFGFTDRSYTITDADRELYQDILTFIEFAIPGIVNHGDGIRIGNGKFAPLIIVDGGGPAFQTDILSMNNIEKVEIINPSLLSYLIGMDAFGGLGGVISILTKSGSGKFENEFIRDVPGRIKLRVRGFRQAREFYSPVYPLIEKDSNNKPDQRPTLFWNPAVLLENGEANIEFYTSDMPGRYRIIAEGISSQGKIISGTAILNIVDVKEGNK
jgi:hypothetical protein